MIRIIKRLRLLAICLLMTLTATPSIRAQQTVAEKPPTKTTPIYKDSVPGVGPIRSEDWFVKTWNTRRAHFRELAAKQQGAIVFFGDSITQGWGDDFRGKFPNLNVANRGISGDITRGLLARVNDDVLSLKPRAIVILIGTNDIGLGISPADIADNIKLLLAQIKKHDPKVPIILCEVMPSSKSKDRPADKIHALNELLAEAVRDNNQVTLLDTYTLFANADGDATKEEFPDLLHPNEIGYEKWRAALVPLLATLGIVETNAEQESKADVGFEPLFNGHDLSGWGFRPTGKSEREMAQKWLVSGKRMPAYPIVDAAENFDGKTESSDGRFRVIAGRLVVTTPTEGRRIQRLDTTRDFSGDFTLKLDFRATPNADSGVFVRGKQLQCRDYTLAGPYKELKKYKPQAWNELVIDVKGNTARCTCNGEVLEEKFELPDSGPIGLEGDRGQMEYRNIRISRQ
jgi:lysophospholipase L1-like esterase